MTDPTARFAEALESMRAGQPGRAEQICRDILGLVPDHSDSLHLLGFLAMQAGQNERAVELITKAIAGNPRAAGYHASLGRALLGLGRLDDAIAAYGEAVAANPSFAEALCDLGNLLLHRGRLDEAIARYEQAIAAKPGFADALSNLGNALRARGRLEEAEVRCREALTLKPDDPGALSNLGNALQAQGKLPEAVACYERALAVAPEFVDALANLGSALSALGRLDAAIACYEKALAIRPAFPEILANLSILLREQGRTAEAVECCRRAIAIRPDFATAYHNLAVALQEMGKIEEARQSSENALALAPHNAGWYLVLAETKRFAPGDAHLATMEGLSRNAGALALPDRILLHFALAKAYDDLGDADSSFAHMREGNALQRSILPYDERAAITLVARIQNTVTREVIASKQGAGHSSSLPIFIVGMPRSGTTLVEQILASHPRVFGAGEMQDFSMALAAMPIPPGAPDSYPEVVPSFSENALRELGATYVDLIRRRAPSAERITDKLPGNFLHLGLIAMALPGARIVHVQRDAADTCFSCFSKLFRNRHEYTFDLAELGRYYKAYERLMAHWRRSLPRGAMLEIRYEELVTDIEAQSRRMIEFCGLGWDPACLEFHKSERPVQTASATQVRQPLYTSSVGRWRRYQHLLKPLLDELGPGAAS